MSDHAHLPPEVYGAMSHACRHLSAAAKYHGIRYGKAKAKLRKHQQKIQRHIARAERYQEGREQG